MPHVLTSCSTCIETTCLIFVVVFISSGFLSLSLVGKSGEGECVCRACRGVGCRRGTTTVL